MSETRCCLVQIDQAKTDIEPTYVWFVVRIDGKDSDQAKDNVENIVGRGPACEAFILRDNETQYANDDEQGSKNEKYVIVHLI